MAVEQTGDVTKTVGPRATTLVECTDTDEQTFDVFYSEVLRPAFPSSQLLDLETMRAAYRTPLQGFHGTIVLDDGVPVAGALGEYSAESGIMLLAYVAVRDDKRGQGIGRGLLSKVLPRWREVMSPVAILAEIEDPRHHTDTGYGDPVARVRMYERLGAKLLPIAYFQPSLAQGLPRVAGMLLICLDPGRDQVDGTAVTAYLDEYFGFCEGEETIRSDRDYLALRDQVNSWNGAVPLWPLSRIGEIAGREGHDR